MAATYSGPLASSRYFVAFTIMPSSDTYLLLIPLFFQCLAGTLIGCLPNNFMAAHAGDHLSDLNSLSDLYDPRIIGLGLTIGVIALVPVWLKHKHERQEARQQQQLQQEQLKQE